MTRLISKAYTDTVKSFIITIRTDSKIQPLKEYWQLSKQSKVKNGIEKSCQNDFLYDVYCLELIKNILFFSKSGLYLECIE